MAKMPLKETVYQTLRKDILSGKILGGSHITESNISKALNVSRTPVREALQRLTQERLVTALPRAGYIIADMSNEDIQDIFSARFDIECLVIRKAVQHITPDELQLLEGNIAQARAHISSGGHEQATLLDLEFHAVVYRASRSKTLYRICKNLGDLTMKYRHGLNLEKGLWDEAIRHHESILEALTVRDEEGAAAAVMAHGEQARMQLIGLMKKVRSDLFLNDAFA